MFRDPYVQKAWELRPYAQRVPFEVLVQAVAWLEDRFLQMPCVETANAIALQYFILAMRRDLPSLDIARSYFQLAMRWRKEGSSWFMENTADHKQPMIELSRLH